LPGERNPQSAAEEFAPSPQGESVLDASMMAELIVTKKEIGRQLKKSAGTSRATSKSPGAGGQRLPLTGRHGAEHWTLWFLGLGALLAAGFAASVRMPVEEKIRTDTAAWTSTLKAIRKIGGSGVATLASTWFVTNCAANLQGRASIPHATALSPQYDTTPR
jgi:hypothetical protein